MYNVVVHCLFFLRSMIFKSTKYSRFNLFKIKIKMRWNESATLEFVRLYLKHECLWNPNNPGYKLKHRRESAYSAICSEFKSMNTLTVPEVKIKIKNLRTTYIQQVNKILQKSSPDCMYEPSIIWFNEMDRCLKHIPSNRHLSSYNTQETPVVDSSSHIWVNQEAQDNPEEDFNLDPLVPVSDNDFDSLKTESSTQIKIERSASPIPTKKMKKKKLKHRSNSIQNSDDSQFERTQEDEFDIYGKYIASQLRKMNLQKALRLQLEIQSLVSEARMSDNSSD